MKQQILFSFLLLFCSTAYSISTCNCVAFRFTGVQNQLQLQQNSVFNLFRQYKIPLTLGVITSQFSRDTEIAHSIQSGLTDSQWRLEVACNGNQLQNYTDASVSAQVQDLTNCSSTLHNLFGRTPVTFIPPQNSFSQDTISAMNQAGYTHLSAQQASDPGTDQSLSVDSVWRFPAGATTSRMRNGYISGNRADATWGQIQNQLNTQGFSVVEIQPYEFSRWNPSSNSYDATYLSQQQLTELKTLLWNVRSSGKRVVLVGEIDQFLDVPYYPPCAAFRLDDIQDWYMTQQQTQVIETFRSYNAPISVGVIANYFGNDMGILNAIKNYMTSPSFEVLSHGWNHEDFTTFDLANQQSLLSQSVSRIRELLGVQVTGFLPPFNMFNANTLTAMITQGFKVVSGGVRQDPPPYSTRTNPPNNGIWRFPEGATTSEQDPAGNYIGLPASTTYTQVINQVADFGFSVIMMHPYEFAAMRNGQPDQTRMNTTQMAELNSLVEMVGLAGIKLVKISELNTC